MTFEKGLVTGFSALSVLEGINRETPFSNNSKYQTKPGIPIPTTVLIKIRIDKSKEEKYDPSIFSILSRHGFFLYPRLSATQ